MEKEKKGKRIKKWMKITLGIVLGVLLVGFLLGSYQIGIQVTRGLFDINKGKDTRANSIKQLETWGYDVTAFEAKYEGHTLELKAEDGHIIPMVQYYAEGNVDEDTVILVHGLGGDYVSVYPQAEMYLREGMNVIAYDQRGGGASTSDIVTFGYYEKQDVKAIVDYVRGNVRDKKLIVHGFSMGAATAGIYGGTDHAKENIDGIILDSSFDSMKSMFLTAWRNMDIDAPEGYVVWCGDRVMRLLYGFGFEDTDVVEAMKTCQVPAMIIQGEKDDVATVAMGEAIYSQIPHEQKIYWLNDAKHIEAYMDYPVQYKDRVLDFIY